MTTETGLDQQVAEALFNVKPARPGFRNNYPRYSTDISAAFEAVEAMRERGWRYTLWDGSSGAEAENMHIAQFFLWEDTAEQSIQRSDHADTLPEAICKAALKALAAQEVAEITPASERHRVIKAIWSGENDHLAVRELREKLAQEAADGGRKEGEHDGI